LVRKNIKIVTLLVFEVQTMGVRRGGQEGALTPLADQNSMFFDFLEENSMFLGFFRQIVCFGPPWKILPSPGKKYADAHGTNFEVQNKLPAND